MSIKIIKKYEYQVIPKTWFWGKGNTNKLNEYGAEGWGDFVALSESNQIFIEREYEEIHE